MNTAPNANEETSVLSQSGFNGSRKKGRLFMVLVLISVVSGIFGAGYASVFYASAERLHLLRGFYTGFSVAFLTAGFELFFSRSFRRGWARRLPFLAALILRVLILTALIRIALIANDVLAYLVGGNEESLKIGFYDDLADEVRDTLVSFTIVIIVVVFAQLSSLIGIARFANLLLGRYFHPVCEDRAFLFIDLKNSTGIAHKLGDIRFHEFLSRFFHEADKAIVDMGGEIVSYVGDAVIVTWPMTANRSKNARPLEALGAIVARIREISPVFIEKFGYAPEFRAALHGGPVVVGECGDSRRQVTFLGEVVNTTSRIEKQTKILDLDFLVSAAAMSKLELPVDVVRNDLGEFDLQGLPKPIELIEIRF